MATEVQVLGLRITVEDADLAKLQAGLKAVGVETTTLAGNTDGLGKSTTAVTAATVEHAARQTTLHEVLGTSRRETMFLEQSLLQLTGTTGIAAHGLEALATGIGPVGLAFVALAGAFEVGKQKMDEYNIGLDSQVAALARAGLSVDEYIAKRKALEDQKFDPLAAMQRQMQFISISSDDLVKTQERLAASDDKLQHSHQQVSVALEASIEKEKEALAINAIKGESDLKVAEGLARLEGKEKEFAANDDVKAHFLDMVPALKAWGAEIINDTEYLRLMGKEAQATLKETAKLTELNEKGKALALANDPIQQRDAAIKAQLQGQTEYEHEQDRLRAKATSATDKAIADAKREADAVKVFQDLMADASTEASAKIVANFQLIADSAGNAADHTAMLHAYINSLPKDVKAKIELAIQFSGNLALMRMLGLGDGGAGAGWGKQQGNQWDFTLSGETNATKQAYIDKYGQTANANAQWQIDHRNELLNQGFTPPAMAEGGIVTGPQIVQVGERGREWIIPEDKMPDLIRTMALSMSVSPNQNVASTVNHFNFTLHTTTPSKSIMTDIAILRAQAGI